MCRLWHCRGLLQQQRLIGQFTSAGLLAGKVTLEELRGAVDGSHRTGPMAAGTELRLHLAAEAIPVGLGHAARQAPIRNDFNGMFGMQHIDEDAVVVLGIPDPQQPEHLDGPFARSKTGQQIPQLQGVFDHETQFTGMRALYFTDPLPDLVQ